MIIKYGGAHVMPTRFATFTNGPFWDWNNLIISRMRQLLGQSHETHVKYLGFILTGIFATTLVLLTVSRSTKATHQSTTKIGLSNSKLDMEPKPKMIVFDLDRTLWPFWVDTHVDPPFTKKSNGKIYDSYGQHVKHFPDVPEMLERLKQDGYVIAAASRTGEIRGAEQLLHLWDWNKYFNYKEIYPGSKVKHFAKFKRDSGIDYKDMLFFDDEYRNIVDISRIGVTCYYCEHGMSKSVLEAGLKKYRDERKSGTREEL